MPIAKNEPMPFALWRDRLALLLVALLPWQARYIKETATLLGVPWEQGTASLYAIDLLLIGAALCHLLAIVTKCAPRKSGAPLWLEVAALIPVYAFISVFWAYDTTAALFTLMRLTEGYALAYLLWVSEASLVSSLTAFVVGTTATAMLGLWQFFTQTSFSSTWLGIAAHPASQAGVSVIETASGRMLRAYGTLPHPNILGGYAAAGLTACLALATRLCRFRPALLGAALVLAAALAASGSRSAWLAAFFTIVIAFVLPRASVAKAPRLAAAPALAAALVGIAWVMMFALPMFAARTSLHGRLETRSISERAASISEGTEMFLRYFATGVGIGNYLPTTLLSLGVPDEPYATQPPHFVPMLVGAELGFLGLALLLGFVGAWWFSALWLMRRAASSLVAVTATLPLIILIVSCFDHYPFDLFAGTMLTGAVFGFFLKAGEEISE